MSLLNRREQRSLRRMTKVEKDALAAYRAKGVELDKQIAALRREIEVSVRNKK